MAHSTSSDDGSVSASSKECDRPAPRLYAYLISGVAAISGLLFGYDIAVINGAIVYLRDQFHLSPVMTELAASSLLAGCVVGAAVAGWLSDRYGRRRILSFAAILFGLSSIAAALPHHIQTFEAARFIGGIAIGVASMLAPLYIAEVSPASIRGRLVSLNQMAIVSGILFAYFTNWLLSFLGPGGWRWMFATAAVPSMLLFIGLFFVPESPRWLAEFGREKDALKILERVSGPQSAQGELRDIRAVIAAESGSWGDLLMPQMRKPLVLGVGLAILQQITGINTVLFYGSLIFEKQLGVHSASAAIGANVAIGIVNFLATIAALVLMDKSGRRPLLMYSAAIMAVCEIILGFAFWMRNAPVGIVLIAMLACVASYAIGLGPATWVLMAEIFPTRIRGRAMSIANGFLWIASFTLTVTFLSLAKAVTVSGAFWIYASLCIVTFILVWRVAPETKGKSLEQIESLWRQEA